MTQDLIDAATTAVDEQRLERAQALAQIAMAQSLADIAAMLPKLIEVLNGIGLEIGAAGPNL